MPNSQLPKRNLLSAFPSSSSYLNPNAEVPRTTRPRAISNQLKECLPDLTFLENADRVLVATFFLPVTIEFSRPVPEPQPFERNPQARGRRKANSDVQDNFSTAFSPAAYLLGRDEPISESSAPRDRTPSFTSAAAAKPPSADFKTGEEPADFKILPATMGNIGLKNAVNSIPQLKAKSLWVGTLAGVSTEMTSKGTMHAINSRWSAEASSIPVLLADETYQLAYEVFAKTVLWKVLHYEINDVPRGQAFDLAAWEAQLLPEAMIGYYQHVPFPSSEILRCLHVRRQILEGMLGADLIGFQSYSYLRHFLITVSRILSLDSSPRGIQLPETVVSVGIYQMGIDVSALHERSRVPAVEEYTKKILKRHAGKQLIVGRDKLDSTKGFTQKLLSFEAFLIKYPDFVGKVTLIQVAIPTNLDDGLAADVGDLVSRINAQFGTIDYLPVLYLQQDIGFESFLGLLAAADACLITSLRDGQNLTSHEFVVMQETKKSPSILSEFAGTYSSFGAALRVNSHDFDQVASRIFEALTMFRSEKEARWEELYYGVCDSAAATFVSSFLSELDRVHVDLQSRYRTNIPKLEVSTFKQAWEAAHTRVLFVDQDGTLYPSKFLQPVALKADGTADRLAPGARAPPSEFSPEKLADLLRDLSVSDPRNNFFLMSGRRRDKLTENAPDDMFEGMGMSAENGCFYRFPDEEWEACFEPDSLTWKKPCLDIINYYNIRTAGSDIEEREASIVWNFAGAEPQFGQRQSAECANQISAAVGANYPIHCLIKRGRLEVLPTYCNKGAVVKRVLERYQMADFVLIIGDDVADEDMFETAEAYLAATGSASERRRSSTTTSTALSDFGEDRWSASGSPRLEGSDDSTLASGPMSRGLIPPPIRLGDAHVADPAPLVRRATMSGYARLLPTTFMTVTTGAKSTKARYFCAGTQDVWELLRAGIESDRSSQDE